MATKNKYAKRSRISEAKIGEVVRYFASDLTALQGQIQGPAAPPPRARGKGRQCPVITLSVHSVLIIGGSLIDRRSGRLDPDPHRCRHRSLIRDLQFKRAIFRSQCGIALDRNAIRRIDTELKLV